MKKKVKRSDLNKNLSGKKQTQDDYINKYEDIVQDNGAIEQISPVNMGNLGEDEMRIQSILNKVDYQKESSISTHKNEMTLSQIPKMQKQDSYGDEELPSEIQKILNNDQHKNNQFNDTYDQDQNQCDQSQEVNKILQQLQDSQDVDSTRFAELMSPARVDHHSNNIFK